MANKNLTPFQSFFFFCSGADIKLLIGEHDKFSTPLHSEYNKYIGIGTSVFFTAVFASISAGFALSFLQGNSVLFCFLGGLFWGLNIFFLDRFIVATMRKGESTWQEKFYEILHSIPRILIGLIFAFTIAVPLEVTLFNGKIMMELEEENQKRIFSNKEGYDKQRENRIKQIKKIDGLITEKTNQQKEELTSLTNQQQALDKQIATLSNAIQENKRIIQQNVYFDRDGILRYNNTAYSLISENNNKQAQQNELINKLNKINTSIQEMQERHKTELERTKTQVEQQKKPYIQKDADIKKDSTNIANYSKTSEQNTDLLARYETLHKLSQKDTGVYFASWLITLLFIVIELAPILSKIIIKKGSYDERLETIESWEKCKISEENNYINENLLNLQNQNKIRQEDRNEEFETKRILKEAKIHEIQELETQKKGSFLAQIAKEKEEESLKILLDSQEIKEKLAKTQEAISVSISTVQSSATAEKNLRERLAKYIEDKQYEHLKKTNR